MPGSFLETLGFFQVGSINCQKWPRLVLGEKTLLAPSSSSPKYSYHSEIPEKCVSCRCSRAIKSSEVRSETFQRAEERFQQVEAQWQYRNQ